MDAALLAAGLGVLIGLILAFTGAGGGVLAIPMLVFGLYLPVQQAGPVGLFAVGIAAAVGAAVGLRQGVVRYRAATLIGLAGMLTAPLGVMLAQWLPSRPLTATFAAVLAHSAWRMWRQPAPAADPSAVSCQFDATQGRLRWTWRCAQALAGTGMLSGLLSGLLGVGGGFVIVPALTRHTDLNLRMIQATSLAVIAWVSVSGITAATLQGAMRWDVALPFGAGAIAAMLAGQRVADKLPAARLRQGFAAVCALVAVLMLAKALGWG
ncbi:MAG: sulfite exporter TauE/SafE family protein [Polaromonas sp.]|nr:sulfite exporter TauE/SafE family protein [Polaromonas sp.]